MKKNYYEILGVSKTAKINVIKQAYRKLAMIWHPDKNKSKEAEIKFKEINEAYKVLSDLRKRITYDYFEYEDDDQTTILSFCDKKRTEKFLENFKMQCGYRLDKCKDDKPKVQEQLNIKSKKTNKSKSDERQYPIFMTTYGPHDASVFAYTVIYIFQQIYEDNEHANRKIKSLIISNDSLYGLYDHSYDLCNILFDNKYNSKNFVEKFKDITISKNFPETLEQINHFQVIFIELNTFTYSKSFAKKLDKFLELIIKSTSKIYPVINFICKGDDLCICSRQWPKITSNSECISQFYYSYDAENDDDGDFIFFMKQDNLKKDNIVGIEYCIDWYKNKSYLELREYDEDDYLFDEDDEESVNLIKSKD